MEKELLEVDTILAELPGAIIKNKYPNRQKRTLRHIIFLFFLSNNEIKKLIPIIAKEVFSLHIPANKPNNSNNNVFHLPL